MPGKDESLLNLLTGLSWRISVLIAAVAYVLFRSYPGNSHWG